MTPQMLFERGETIRSPLCWKWPTCPKAGDLFSG
jgi:hypothetical protein